MKRQGGALTKELEVEVEGAKPGTKHPLTLDGFELATLTMDLDGEADFELLASQARPLPTGCPEPKAGSRIRLGELVQLELQTLERGLDLEAAISGPGKLSGKVTFRLDRLGSAQAREFQVKVAGAPAETVQVVILGDVEVGNLEVEEDGKGKLELSTRMGGQLPSAWVDPSDGTAVRIGTLFSGELRGRKRASD
jgi:hypothetical protein